MIPAYNKMRCAAFPFETGIHFRQKTDFFPEEDTTKSYSGFEPEPTREIGSRVGRSQTTLMRICDRWMQEGMTDRRGRSHPPQSTTSLLDTQMVRMAVTDRSVRL
ncbi:uncharacterized protein TNCV_931761 [Trichonephila clavipes]|uniref:Uncharacterized protein n=1 Tax=Trichonephila clavipes TaxID=2585209 RepID=A0A8X6W2G3_TRICX|nr:uncharacterized protein TNCV_931761 [Trichonephila clavipes]